MSNLLSDTVKVQEFSHTKLHGQNIFNENNNVVPIADVAAKPNPVGVIKEKPRYIPKPAPKVDKAAQLKKARDLEEDLRRQQEIKKEQILKVQQKAQAAKQKSNKIY